MNDLQELKNQLLNLTKEQSTELILSLKNEINEKNQNLETWDRISNDNEWFKMSEVAKLLIKKDKKYKTFGRNTIFSILRDNKILMSNNEPYQTYVDRGYFKVIVTDKCIGAVNVTIISGKGIDFIRRILDELNTDK